MRRVLVVDDEENIRLVLKTLLKRHGYDVETADSGESALALVDSFGPDVILTDVRMPKMNGLDLLATLKAKQNPATVIVMSAYGSVDLALEAMKAGAYDYVGKPFKPDEIVLTVAVPRKHGAHVPSRWLHVSRQLHAAPPPQCVDAAVGCEHHMRDHALAARRVRFRGDGRFSN